MTYDLTIGKYTEDDPDEDGYIYRGVEWEENPEAPALPESVMSCHTNHISIPWSGYTDVANGFAAYDEGLTNLLFKGSNDPVNIPLTPELVARIRRLTAAYRQDHPKAVPGFSDAHDWVFARMIILEWWANYSIKTYGANAMIHIS